MVADIAKYCLVAWRLTNSFAAIPSTSLEMMDIAKSVLRTWWNWAISNKETYCSVARIIYDIFNSSFDFWHVPHSLKIACRSITPILKQGDRLKNTIYRSVSILPHFFKIMEKSMCTRLNSYIEKFKHLYPGQFSFRSGHSTDMALVNLHDLITDAVTTYVLAK